MAQDVGLDTVEAQGPWRSGVRRSLTRRLLGLLPLVLAIVGTFVIHDAMDGGRQTGGDSLWNTYLSYSLLDEGDLDLDEWATIRETYQFNSELREGTWVSTFPLGTGIVSTPFVGAMAAYDSLSGGDFVVALQDPFPPAEIETTIASMWVGLTAGMLMYLSRPIVGTGAAAAAVGLFSFGTSAISSASRALWTHGPAMAVLTLSLIILQWVRHRSASQVGVSLRSTWPVALLGPLAVVGWVIRPTTAIGVGMALAMAALRHRAAAALGLLVAVPAAVLYLIVSRDLYVTWQGPYYNTERVQGASTWLEALAGNLMSPGRGLLVWSPIFLLVVASIPRMKPGARSADADVLRCAGATIVVHYAVVSRLDPWWAGWSVGPRLLTDVAPHLVLLAVVGGLALFRRARRTGDRLILVLAMSVLTSISVYANCRAALDDGPVEWHVDPVPIEEDPARLWDYGDIPFLR